MSRTCTHCRAYLRAGNRGPRCGPCEKRIADAALERVRSYADGLPIRTPGVRGAIPRAILAALAERPRRTAGELALAIGRDEMVMRSTLARMLRRGLVTRDKDGGLGLWRYALGEEAEG